MLLSSWPQALVEVGGAGVGGGLRVVAGVEAAAVRAQAEAAAGGGHELQRSHGAGARAHVHPARGFLGHDPEQQRLGQAALLEGRRHQVAHVLVVLVAGDERHAHVGQPAADALLHRRVELRPSSARALASLVQQRGGVGGAGHRAVGEVGFVDQVEVAVVVQQVVAGAGLQQRLVAGQHRRQLAAALLAAGFDGGADLGHRRVGLGQRGLVVLAQQRVAVALLGAVQTRLQGIDGGLLALGQRGAGIGGGKRGGNGDREGGKRHEETDGHRHDHGEAGKNTRG